MVGDSQKVQLPYHQAPYSAKISIVKVLISLKAISKEKNKKKTTTKIIIKKIEEKEN